MKPDTCRSEERRDYPLGIGESRPSWKFGRSGWNWDVVGGLRIGKAFTKSKKISFKTIVRGSRGFFGSVGSAKQTTNKNSLW